MDNKNIGLDIDGVLADFSMAWHLLYPEINPRPKIWNFDEKISARFKSMKKNGVLDKFYSNIKPLIKPIELPFEPTCYITARPVNSNITEEWLELHEFPTKPVITVGVNKTKIKAAKENNIDIFVDDNYDNFVELNEVGVFCYLFTASWNIKYDVGHMRLNSLKDLVTLI